MIVCKYKFDSSIYNNLIPEFNSGYNGYTVNDTTDGNIITRTIECDTLPTLIRFGQVYTDGEVQQDYTRCLLEVLDMNTSKLTSCSNMFRYCTNLTSINCNWNTSNVTNMRSMFQNCFNLTQLDVSNFNTSNVTNMNSMFFNCHNLASLDLSNFNTSNVTDMGYITYQCRSLKTLSLSSWNFDSVTTAVEMFYDCYSLVTLDAPNMRIPTYGNNFFGGTCPVKYIRVNNLDVINTIEPQLKYARTSDNPGYIITNIAISSIPADTISALSSKNWTVVSDSTLTKVAEYVYDSKICRSMIPKFNDEFVKYFIDDVEDENGLVTRIISSMDELPTLMRFGQAWVSGEVQEDYTRCLLEILDMNTSKLTNCSNMFRYCTNLTSINCNWNTSKVTTMHAMFNACTNLTSLDVSNFNTSQVTDMHSMFHNCINLTQLDVSNFNTSQVTYMDAMFYNCNKLTSLDVSNFDTSNAANMEGMFNNCNNLAQLDVSNFNTSNVTNMYGMFNSCTNLTQLDVSNFDISNVNTMRSMFSNCTNLTQLDVSNFDTSNVNNMDYMFNNTFKLVNIGMLYCSLSTINTISSNLSNTLQKNIWIQNVKPSELPSYDYISYKKYKEEKELNLNSPLLEGDKIVKKDGKMYHYHKMGKVVLDGSEDWFVSSSASTVTTVIPFYMDTPLDAASEKLVVCDKISSTYKKVTKLEAENIYISTTSRINASILKSKLSTQDVQGFKQWLSKNPTTVVYELANPYYEEISNDTLYLSIDKLADYKMVVNNSTIPTKNMVQNRTFSTITLKPNTVYTVKFDRIGTDELTIDLGGTITTCVGNKVEIITSNEITRDDIVFYGDDEISNVMVIESSFDENNIPKENFEGLKSSFEDNKLPSEEDNLVDSIKTNVGKYGTFATIPAGSLKPLTNYTLFLRNNGEYIKGYINENIFEGDAAARTFNIHSNNCFMRSYKTLDSISVNEVRLLKSWDEVSNIDVEVVFLEGDWTHLTEEDFNNLGKYKVEYKTINCPIEFGKGGRIK